MSSLRTATVTDDADLIAASLAGGIEAFGQLVERYQSLVCAVAYSNTGDRLLSEDIGQETFLTAWSKLDTVREPDKLRSWLCGIARNLSSKAVRVRKREHLSGAESIDSNAGDDPGPLAAAITKETEATVWQALEELPKLYREPLVLFYREDKSIKQVATGLGLTEDAAKQRLSRGRQALKDGVSSLVEQTLESSRPSKAFTAGVLALIGAAAAPGSAAAAQSAAKANASKSASAAGGVSKLLWLGLSAAALLALVVGGAVMRSSWWSSQPQDQMTAANPSANPNSDRAILAILDQRRKAMAASASAISCEFQGKVVGRGGDIVPGASVAITKDSMQSSLLDPSAIQTEADGTWRFGPVPRGSYLVSITAPGHLPQTRMERCQISGAHSVDTPLTAGGTRLHGTIADIGGGPVGDVTIWLIPTLGETGAAITTRTDGDGVYDLSVHPDRYMMLIVHPDYVLNARPVLVSGQSAQEDFVVLPGAIVEGTVVGEHGEPIAGAKVSTGGVSLPLRNINRSGWMLASLFGAMFPVETDSAGRYRLSGLPPGSAQIHARTSALVSGIPVQVDLAIAETETDVQVTVAEAFKVSGFVVNADTPRESMANVVVLLQPEDAITTPNFAITDDSGYFEAAGLLPGSYHILAGGGEAAPLVLEEAVRVSDADIADLLIKAQVGVAISGEIRPAERASVRLEAASDGMAAGPRHAAAAMTRAEVDGLGRFRFPSVADGEYVIVANTLDGEGRAPVTVAGGDVTDVSVNVTRLADITGRVVDDTGAPVVGALVAAKPKRLSGANAYVTQLHTRDRTDSAGQFEILGVHPATYEVRVFSTSGQRAWADPKDHDAFDPQIVEVSRATVAMDLLVASKGKAVRGVVVAPDGAPVEDAWVEVRARSSRYAPAGYQQMPALTNSSGEFEIHGLFGDEFKVEATGPRGKLQSAPMTIENSEPVTLQLAALSTVVATVKRDGELVADFDVDVSDGPSRVIGRMLEKRNGTFELERLVSGDYKIEVKAGDSYVQKVVSVGPAPITSIDLQLQPTSGLRGRVLDARGAPMRGARIVVFGLGLRVDGLVDPAGIAVRDDGSFEVGGLAAGRGNVLVRRSADEADPVAFLEIELKPGQVLDLGTVQRGQRQSLADAPFADTSEDLGIRFFSGPARPTSAQLQRIDESDDPRSLLQIDGARLWIATVVPGSPAEQAGLRVGDSVLAVGQMQIGDDLPPSEALISLSQSWRSKGRAVDWVIERGGRQLEFSVVVPR